MENLKSPLTVDYPLYFKKSVTSTMDYAKELIEKESPSPFLCYTDYQTEGRGRGKGRKWDALEGESLLCSFVVSQKEAENSFPISLMAGAVLLEVIQKRVSTFSLTLKWPNDILYNKKKVAGILTETYKGFYIVGMGVNLNQSKFLENLSEKATSLKLISKENIDRKLFIKELLNSFKKALLLKDVSPLVEKINNNLYKREQKVTLNIGPPQKPIYEQCIPLKVNLDGTLKIKDQKGLEKNCFVGEIIF